MRALGRGRGLGRVRVARLQIYDVTERGGLAMVSGDTDNERRCSSLQDPEHGHIEAIRQTCMTKSPGFRSEDIPRAPITVSPLTIASPLFP